MSEEKQHYWHGIEKKAVHARERDAKKQQREMEKYVLKGDAVDKAILADTKLIMLTPVFGACVFISAIVLIVCGRWILGICSAAVGILDLVFLWDRLQHRARTAKYSIVQQVIEQYFHPEIYLAYKRLPDEIIREADISDDWSSATVSDYFVGTWRGVQFEFGDLTLRGRRSEGKGKEVIFMGQLFIFSTGLGLSTPISIRERLEPLSQEVYEGRKTSDRFFLTGNEQFDRQFEVRLGSNRSVNGFERSEEGKTVPEIRREAHLIVDDLASDIIEADSYAVSHTSMRFVGNRLYLAVENTRDSFEFRHGDEKDLSMMRQRFEEELKDMTLYLDLLTKGIERVRAARKPSK